MKQLLNRKTGYLDMSAVLEDGVDVYFILGQRSDGKTYGVLEEVVKDYFALDAPSAYIRRFDESLKKNVLFDLTKPQNGNIVKYSKGKWNNTTYRVKRFYMTKDDETIDTKPFLYAYSLNTWENSKGADSGYFRNVIFDEAVSAGKYLPNEYSVFENVLSSILRNRGNSRLFLLGNPLNQICPYFDEFNLEPDKLKPGDIVYRKSKNGYTMKFVYVPAMDLKHRLSNKFFDFGNTSSITTGYWEFGEYPHLPSGLAKQSEKLGQFAILFRKQFAVCEFYAYGSVIYAFWRPGNCEKILADSETALFSDAHLFQPNVYTAWTRNMLTSVYEQAVKSNRQYFADNKTGNLVSQWYNGFVRTAGRFG